MSHETVARRVVGAHVLVTLLLLWLGLAAGQTPLQLVVTAGAVAVLGAVAVRLGASARPVPVEARVTSAPPTAYAPDVTPRWRHCDVPRQPARPRAPGVR